MIQYSWQFVNSVRDFYGALRELHLKDPEQELQGSAIFAYNQILMDAKVMLHDHPLIQSLPEIITADNIEEPVYPRVADTLIVVSQIWSALGTGRPLT